MMTPIFLNNPQNTAPYFNLNQDHQQQQIHVPSSPFCPSIVASNTTGGLHLDQGLMLSTTHIMSDQSQPFIDQLQGSKNGFFDERSPSYGAQVNSTETYGSHNHDDHLFIFKKQEDQEQNSLNITKGIVVSDDINGSSLKWMSSKMRMMRKMINNSNGPKADHPRLGSIITPPPSSNKLEKNNPQLGTNNNNNVIRTCSDCNTTGTPLWRSGPQGPKTLCNACGIRQRKARKAATAAATALNTSSTEASSSTLTKTTIKLLANKDKKKSRVSNNTTCVSQHSNKRQANNQLAAADSDPNNSSTTSSRSRKQQLRFEEFAVNLLRENAAFCRMFPQDEEEGALLLMALSYDLIHS